MGCHGETAQGRILQGTSLVIKGSMRKFKAWIFKTQDLSIFARGLSEPPSSYFRMVKTPAQHLKKSCANHLSEVGLYPPSQSLGPG